MMNEKLVKALNEQIAFEFESAYLYLAMAIKMKDNKYPGYGLWLQKQYEEEMGHAMKFISYLEDRDEKPQLQDIVIPKVTFDVPLDVAKAVLKHEQLVTTKINGLYKLALAEEDYATQQLLGWYITEQVEEEANARDIIDNFTFAGENRASQMLVDSKLGARQ